MKHVTLGRVAVILALVTAAVSFVFGDYDRAESNMRRFYVQIQKADFKAARQSIDEAVRLWPSNARYYGWRAYCIAQALPSQCPAHGAPPDARTLEQIRGAAADYRRALELNIRDAVAHHNLAWLDHLMGQEQEARQEWEQAISIDPATAIYHLSLGLFLEEAGDSEGARRKYIAAIELAPAILDSPFFTRYNSRSPGGAESVVHEATVDTEARLKAGDDPILKARLGKFYLYRHDLQRAAECLASSAHDLPNLPLVWFNLGEVRRLQGNWDEAWASYGKARFLDASLAGPALRIAGNSPDGPRYRNWWRKWRRSG